MPFTSEKEDKIREKAKEANVSGVSVAMVGPEGDISTLPIGTTSCGFFKMKEPPSESIQKSFDSSRYILTNTGFYFYNHSKKELETIPTTESQQEELKQYVNKDMFALTDEKLTKIQSITGHQAKREVITEESIFGAASLSKPVFAYLVLKLIEKNKTHNATPGLGQFNLEQFGLKKFDLDTPLVNILPGLSEAGKQAERLTAGMVLAHTTGIPMSAEGQVPTFLFEPGTEYGYNGVPLVYLQLALEKLTGATLEELAQENVFGAKALDMKHSSFIRPGFETSGTESLTKDETDKLFPIDFGKLASISANSLSTTAQDYARLMRAWMNDPALAEAFKSQVPLTQDQWAKGMALPQELLEKLSWGLGIGLQVNGDKTTAFHSGDMNQWRAIVAMDLDPKSKTGIVYFTNSPNGDVLAKDITDDIVDVKDGLSYISEKYGFATKFEEDWEAKQQQRFDKVGYYFESVDGMHTSEAEWVAEEKGYQADQQDTSEHTLSYRDSVKVLRELEHNEAMYAFGELRVA